MMCSAFSTNKACSRMSRSKLTSHSTEFFYAMMRVGHIFSAICLDT